MSAVVQAFPDRSFAPRFALVIEMTVAEWHAVPANPRQRNTENRARSAKHLKALHASHEMVSAARLPDGSMLKLDGHTRDHIWYNGLSDSSPSSLKVCIWDCASVADAMNLYSTFDSRSAMETSSDKIFGGAREHNLSFQSEIFKSHRYAAALRVSYEFLFGQVPARDAEMNELLRYWSPELMILDSCMPTRKRFNTGVLAAALLTARRYGDCEEVKSFWVAYGTNSGSKIGNEMDAVQALTERMTVFSKGSGFVGRARIRKIVATSISAYERWKRREMYKTDGGGIKALGEASLSEWIAAAKNIKRAA